MIFYFLPLGINIHTTIFYGFMGRFLKRLYFYEPIRQNGWFNVVSAFVTKRNRMYIIFIYFFHKPFFLKIFNNYFSCFCYPQPRVFTCLFIKFAVKSDYW